MSPPAAPLSARPIVMMVTDRRRYAARGEEAALRALLEDARGAAAAGVDLIQVRERGLADRALLAAVRRVLATVEGTAARVLVNTRTDVALAAPAHGVHVPASSPPVHRIRAVTPPGFLLGRSVHGVEEAIAAEQRGGCDYLIFGTVYPSTSKPAGHSAAGVDTLARVCAAVRLPVLAIGGVAPDRLPEIAAAGAAGVAAISVFAAPHRIVVEGAPSDVAGFVGRARGLSWPEDGARSGA